MNVGINCGEVKVFKFDIFLKFVDIKGVDGKIILFYFVV